MAADGVSMELVLEELKAEEVEQVCAGSYDLANLATVQAQTRRCMNALTANQGYEAARKSGESPRPC